VVLAYPAETPCVDAWFIHKRSSDRLLLSIVKVASLQLQFTQLVISPASQLHHGLQVRMRQVSVRLQRQLQVRHWLQVLRVLQEVGAGMEANVMAKPVRTHVCRPTSCSVYIDLTVLSVMPACRLPRANTAPRLAKNKDIRQTRCGIDAAWSRQMMCEAEILEKGTRTELCRTSA
jgi:hypothetical protein